MSMEISGINIKPDTLERILLAMTDARLLCDYFMDKNNHSERGKCMYYSCVLQTHLNENLPEFDWKLDGGWEIESDSGIVDESNLPGGMIADYSDEYESHYWVKCSQLDIICDTSSSQFGTANIFVTAMGNPIYNSNLDSTMIEDEIRFDSGLRPYSDTDIEKQKDSRERFDMVLSKIMSNRNNKEFLAWKEKNIQDYVDDMNDYINPSLKSTPQNSMNISLF